MPRGPPLKRKKLPSQLYAVAFVVRGHLYLEFLTVHIRDECEDHEFAILDNHSQPRRFELREELRLQICGVFFEMIFGRRFVHCLVLCSQVPCLHRIPHSHTPLRHSFQYLYEHRKLWNYRSTSCPATYLFHRVTFHLFSVETVSLTMRV